MTDPTDGIPADGHDVPDRDVPEVLGIMRDHAEPVADDFSERVLNSIQVRETVGHAGELSWRVVFAGLFELLGMMFSIFTPADSEDEGED